MECDLAEVDLSYPDLTGVNLDYVLGADFSVAENVPTR